MTRLTIHDAAAPHKVKRQTNDAGHIADLLQGHGVRFKRWPLRPALPYGAAAEDILRAYGPDIERLLAEGGYRSADVVRVHPLHPDRAALRQRFIEEHTHADDEVRLFVEGRGAFYLHLGDEVLQLVCEAGDLLNVPAGTRHWFDMGPEPSFTAIRLFESPAGWEARFTGDPISAHVPRFGPLPA